MSPTLRRVEAYEAILQRLDRSGVHYRIHTHERVVTVDESATHLRFDPRLFLKTLAFAAEDQQLALVGLRGADRLNYRALAAALNVRRAGIRRASLLELAACGFEAGGVAPFKLADNVRVLIDSRALDLPLVLCGVGRSDRALEIAPADLLDTGGGERESIADSV